MNKPKTKYDFDDISAAYDRCNHLFSFGIDHLWRRHLVTSVNAHPRQHVLDLCCGTGDVVFSFLKHGSVGHVTGLDISERMIDLAQEKQIRFSDNPRMRNKTLSWKVADAVRTGLESNTFDFVTCAFGIRNIPDRMAALKEMCRVLKPKGKLCILEFSLPSNPLLRGPYQFYLGRMMPLLGKWVVGAKEPLQYLSQSIRHWHNEVHFSTELSQAGFKLIRKTPLTCGLAALWVAAKNG
ncbi:MAG: bifunctional demethylmenaquinone methyltransferase/2-methoxy-6-polyprenyl-1,4-benzoquinol methylase UbiE [Planctomycetota bacterium]|jgi:demethylmenaquinone methyltransferase/2-methoxy-6-polyprenyl-1,4-benzoquinol methylase